MLGGERALLLATITQQHSQISPNTTSNALPKFHSGSKVPEFLAGVQVWMGERGEDEQEGGGHP